jgi:hypothetical protein
LFGLGWDLPLAGRWLVGSQVVLNDSAFGLLENEGTVVAQDVGLSIMRLGGFLRRS